MIPTALAAGTNPSWVRHECEKSRPGTRVGLRQAMQSCNVGRKHTQRKGKISAPDLLDVSEQGLIKLRATGSH